MKNVCYCFYSAMSSGFVRDVTELIKEVFSALISNYEDMDLNILNSFCDMDGRVTCALIPLHCLGMLWSN